jgi:hypothetical protein
LKRGVLDQNKALIVFITQVRPNEFLDLYLFKLATGKTRYALVSTPTGYVVTILKPGMPLWTAKGRFMLGQGGLEALHDA